MCGSKHPEHNHPFIVLDDSNSVLVHMNNPATGDSAEILTLDCPKAIHTAITVFAHCRYMDPVRVQYAVRPVPPSQGATVAA